MPAITNVIMSVDYSKKNLQKASFKDENLASTSFLGSDIRGADFSGADLTGADFRHIKTGITPTTTGLLFFVSLVISLSSGYLAMLAGSTVQIMLKSGDGKLRAAGIISLVLIALFIIYLYLKGGRTVLKHVLIPAFTLAIVIGGIAYFSGLGSGKGMLFLGLSLLLVVIMVTVGTAARVLAGVLSSTILFVIVALGGGMFGKSLGGGIGSVVLAISCALISKRVLSGAKGFDSLKNLALKINTRFGTSFRNANLTNANFSHSIIRNADFTNADISSVNWDDAKKQNCIPADLKV